MNLYGKTMIAVLIFMLVAVPASAQAVTVWYQPTPLPLTTSTPVHITDGWVTSVYYEKKFIQDDRLQVGGWADVYRTYVRFDLDGLPTSVNRATLMLMPYKRGDNSMPTHVGVHRPTASWTAEMTWNTQPGSTFLGWIAPPVPDSWWGLDLTETYNKVWKAEGNNFGLRLDPYANQNNFNVFRSSRYSDYYFDPSADGKRPALQLEFTPPIGMPNFRIPLPGGLSWLVTTEIGGYDCKGYLGKIAYPDPGHMNTNYFSIDFAPQTKETNPYGINVPVLAAADGTVVFAGEIKNLRDGRSQNGLYVVINHSGGKDETTGYTTRYLHLKEGSIKVKKGQLVRQGDQLGVMGSTGNSTGVHLHFGVRYGNDGSASNSPLTSTLLDALLLKSFQTECDASNAWIRYYRSTNRIS